MTVAEQGRWAPDAGYASAYFKSDSDEKIYQAATSGNDFFTFSPVNDGKPVITSTTDTKGLRDPYILRSKDGDKYYMVATDLCIGVRHGLGPGAVRGQPQGRGVGVDRPRGLDAHQRRRTPASRSTSPRPA